MSSQMRSAGMFQKILFNPLGTSCVSLPIGLSIQIIKSLDMEMDGEVLL